MNIYEYSWSGVVTLVKADNREEADAFYNIYADDVLGRQHNCRYGPWIANAAFQSCIDFAVLPNGVM